MGTGGYACSQPLVIPAVENQASSDPHSLALSVCFFVVLGPDEISGEWDRMLATGYFSRKVTRIACRMPLHAEGKIQGAVAIHAWNNKWLDTASGFFSLSLISV